LCACTQQLHASNLVFENTIEGCFSFKSWKLDTSSKPVLLHAIVGLKNKGKECPGKSALIKYTVVQKTEDGISSLLSARFTTLGKEKANLPIATQKQLIFPNTPITVSFSCG